MKAICQHGEYDSCHHVNFDLKEIYDTLNDYKVPKVSSKPLFPSQFTSTSDLKQAPSGNLPMIANVETDLTEEDIMNIDAWYNDLDSNPETQISISAIQKKK